MELNQSTPKTTFLFLNLVDLASYNGLICLERVIKATARRCLRPKTVATIPYKLAKRLALNTSK